MSKILVVDDEECIRDILTMILESNFDCGIIEAKSGNEAIQLLERDKSISMIFCDYRMNDGNGGDVYRYVKSSGNKIPYTLVSTYDPQDYDEFGSFHDDNPLNTCFSKPFSEDQIVDQVKKSLKEVKVLM